MKRHPSDSLPFRIVRTPGGHAARGPGFHVWEEDRRELLARAAELMRSAALPPARDRDRRRRQQDGGG